MSLSHLRDADGNRVKGTVSTVTTVYVAGVYERQGAAYTSYYEGGGLRRTGYSTNNGVFYMLSDHLRSTSALVARNGVLNVKYFYYADGRRVALRRTGYAADNALFYLLPDHLGSTTVVANPAGTPHSETLYKAWGETRYETTPLVPTDFRFTGQREVAEMGLYYYGARYFDASKGRRG